MNRIDRVPSLLDMCIKTIASVLDSNSGICEFVLWTPAKDDDWAATSKSVIDLDSTNAPKFYELCNIQFEGLEHLLEKVRGQCRFSECPMKCNLCNLRFLEGHMYAYLETKSVKKSQDFNTFRGWNSEDNDVNEEEVAYTLCEPCRNHLMFGHKRKY